jgi:hypothetical protein
VNKYTATVTVQTVEPTTEAPVVIKDIEAPHPLKAARIVADQVAATMWGGLGVAPYITGGKGGQYLAAVGEFSIEGGWGFAKGHTLRITIEPA